MSITMTPTARMLAAMYICIKAALLMIWALSENAITTRMRAMMAKKSVRVRLPGAGPIPSHTAYFS